MMSLNNPMDKPNNQIRNSLCQIILLLSMKMNQDPKMVILMKMMMNKLDKEILKARLQHKTKLLLQVPIVSAE